MKLYSQAITSSLTDAPHLVLLHGWGVSSKIWAPFIDFLSPYYDITLVDLPGFGGSTNNTYATNGELLNALREVMPERFSLLGFSLGGMLAVKLAEHFPESVERVVTVGSNAVFVADNEWPEAMSGDTYQQFYQLAEKSLALVLKRFLALQAKGADKEKELLKTLRLLTDEIAPTANGLLDSLNLLTELDNRQSIKKLQRPLLSIFGDGDQLVPVTAVEKVRLLGSDVAIIQGASHVPFISHPQQFFSLVHDFLSVDHKLRSKIAVAKSFSKAAASYDSVAELQRDVGNNLLSYLPENTEVERVVDLGCGTGYFLSQLAEQSRAKQIIAFDLAEGMLSFAKSHRKDYNYMWLCGDAESLPLDDGSVDVIFSSLAIQWCESDRQLFTEIQRVLKPGGQFVFSTLGPKTLSELRIAWQAVDDYVHVNHFEKETVIRSAIDLSGLQLKRWHEESICLQYHKLTELTRELKSLGAHNVNTGRPEGLMGKQRIKTFKAAYEAQRDEQGLLPASYQVWYGVVEKLGVSDG